MRSEFRLHRVLRALNTACSRCAGLLRATIAHYLTGRVATQISRGSVMSVNSTGSPSRRVGTIDFWRGLVLVAILCDHIPGNLLEKATPRNFALSDSAEAFVFLSGSSRSRSPIIGEPSAPIGAI